MSSTNLCYGIKYKDTHLIRRSLGAKRLILWCNVKEKDPVYWENYQIIPDGVYTIEDGLERNSQMLTSMSVKNGQLHNDFGPCCIYEHGACVWYWHGEYVSFSFYLELNKLLSEEDKMFLKLKYDK